VCLHRDHEGLMAGTHRIAQIHHPGARCHREGRRQRTTGVVEACAESTHGVGLIWAGRYERGHTRHRACAFQASQHDARVQQGLRGRGGRLLVAQTRFPWEGGSPHQLRKKGAGAGILLRHVGQFALEALREPSELDQGDTGVRRSIVASDTRHRRASGG